MPVSSSLEQLYASSHLYGGNADYIEAWYETWLADPAAVPEQWRKLFDSLPGEANSEQAHRAVEDRFRNLTNGSAMNAEQLAGWTA